MFALFEDGLTIIHGTAGFAAFGSSTNGYGYSPSSRTISACGGLAAGFAAFGSSTSGYGYIIKA